MNALVLSVIIVLRLYVTQKATSESYLMITDRKLIGLKPKASAYDVRDRECFVVRVYPSGNKVFQYVPRINGKEKRIKIGNYPSTSLSEARDKHRELIGKRERGELDKPLLTYKEVYQGYKKYYASTYADNGVEFQRIHDRDILSIIGNVKISELKKSDIMRVQERKKTTPRQANITIEKISKVCRYAVGIGLIEVNPCAYLPKLPENPPRQVVLTHDQIYQLCESKNEVDKYLFTILCTGMRGGEIKAHYSELSAHWIDVDQRKGGKVSTKAVYIPVTVRRLKLKRLSDKTSLAMSTRRRGVGYTPHDCRRTAATLLAELGYADYIIDRWLGHSVSKLKATYIVSRREKQLREMTVMLNRHIRRICRKKVVKSTGKAR